MDKNQLKFEQVFAKQMTELANHKFSEKIIGSLWDKKNTLMEKVLLYDELPVFTPVIPTSTLECIDQAVRFALCSDSSKDKSILYSYYLNGFFYNEKSAVDLSNVKKPGFLIDVQSKKISEISIPEKFEYRSKGKLLSEAINNLGYIPMNHTEAFTLCWLTNLLPSNAEFCALSFSWDGYEFASVFRGRELRYGLGWVNPDFDKTGKYKASESNKHDILIPMYKEVI
jgi:hypothetical protein